MSSTATSEAKPNIKQTTDDAGKMTSVEKIKFGAIQATIFKKTVSTSDDSFDAYSVVVDRWYKKDDGTGGYTHSLNPKDCLIAAHALQKAFDRIEELKRQ